MINRKKLTTQKLYFWYYYKKVLKVKKSRVIHTHKDKIEKFCLFLLSTKKTHGHYFWHTYFEYLKYFYADYLRQHGVFCLPITFIVSQKNYYKFKDNFQNDKKFLYQLQKNKAKKRVINIKSTNTINLQNLVIKKYEFMKQNFGNTFDRLHFCNAMAFNYNNFSEVCNLCKCITQCKNKELI
jgi:hypothetical protein